MYSFYGGRPGNSFIIITTYRSIADMVAKFKQGPNYTAVHYDEHVMINTVNKNDPDNGKVYRRGYDFTNTMGGAEYIGTIVGPAGKAPMLEMTTVADVKSKHASEGYDERFSSGQYSPTDGNLVPGKTGSGTFNDAITWKCCSIRNENDEDATAYIGFTFPYTVIDYETSNVEPYVSGRYADTSSATRVDDGKHPFFEKWHINVPKGVKGDSLKNFRIETASSTVQPYDGQTDDINNNRKILIYDYYNYDNKQDGDPKTFYLGDYNMIEDISMSNDGTITIQYTHDDNITFSKKLKWINSVNLNTSNGVFTVNYNNGADYSTTLDWIKSVNIENDGTVTFGHVNNEVTEFQNKIKWCTDVQINNNGTITFKWNNGTQDTVLQNKIQWIDAVNLANDGTITVTYNTPDENNPSNPKQQIINTIKWIKSIDLNQTGTLTVTYNTLDQTSTQNPKPNETVSFPNALKSISSVTHTLNTKADHGRKGELYINYNNNESDMIELDLLTDVSLDQDTGIITTEWNNDFVQRIGAVNFIKNLAIDSGGNLLVKYSNPQERGDISVGGDVGWTLLGKVAPYGNNTNMTISRILRGKHYLDATDNKVYLEFYIENVGLLRLSDTAIISSGTATMYYNGTKVGSDISLVNKEINSLPDSATTLNTLNFKIELDSSTYPITASNSPHLVDVELKDVVLNIIRENSDDRIADIRDQQRQIDQNTSNISTLNRDLNNIDNNIVAINNRIDAIETNQSQTSSFNMINVDGDIKIKNIDSNSYIQQPAMIMAGLATINRTGTSDKNVTLCTIPPKYRSGYRIIPFVSRRYEATDGTPSDDGDFYYAYYNSVNYKVFIKTAKILPQGVIYQYDWIIYAVPETTT